MVVKKRPKSFATANLLTIYQHSIDYFITYQSNRYFNEHVYVITNQTVL